MTTYVLQKDLKNTTGLFVDQTRNTLDATTTSETTDSGLRDAWWIKGKNMLLDESRVATRIGAARVYTPENVHVHAIF